MRREFRFLGALAVGLSCLAVIGHIVVSRQTRRWLEEDLARRAQLAVTSARRGHVGAWASDHSKVFAILTDITRDERIMGSAACSANGEMLASTSDYPTEFSCQFVSANMVDRFATSSNSWATTPELPNGAVHLGIVSVGDGKATLGTVILVHDLSFISRRETTANMMMLLAYFILLAGASAVTLLSAKFAWKDWTLGLRRALKGQDTQRHFLPVLREVRALAKELAREHETESY